MKEMINECKTHGDEERYDYYVSMQNAASVSHTMNNLVRQGEIGGLSKVAQRMDKEHFELMSQIPGSGTVMEIYEMEFKRLIARDKRLTATGYRELRNSVKEKIKLLNKKGIIRSQFESQRKAPGANQTD